MKRSPRILVLVALVVPLLGGSPGVAAASPGEGAAEEFYVVGFASFPRGLKAGQDFHGGRVQRIDPVLHFARVSTTSPGTFRARARGDPRVRFVERDPEIKLIEFTPNDPRYPQQYGPQLIRAPQAWDTTLGDLDAAVCVVDTGVRYTHEDIASSRWLGGYDYYNGDADPWDDNGHGTHVTGSAAASINNAKGIAGVANVGIFGVKALGANGAGSWSMIASAIRWCADNGGPRVVISMSLGGFLGAIVLQDAVQYAQGKGALLVAAAGNGGPCTNCVNYPAKYPEVMAVTCVDSSKTQCSFSSDGPESELTAPGLSVLSLWHTSDTAYNTISGTSMSTPHVSGVAALAWSQFTGMTNSQLRQALRDNAQDLGVAGWDELYGYGLVDAAATLGAGPPPPPPPESRIYFEDFDDGAANGWTVGGLWHVSSVCSVPPSTPNYVGYNEDSDCQYSTGARTTGSAAFDVDLTGKTAATLKYAERYEKETFAGGSFDVMRVEVSADGGATWTTLRQRDSRNANQLTWANQSQDLVVFAGKAIKIRFLFDSVDHLFNNYAGWFIDNVEVTADAGGVGNLPPVANAGLDQVVADDDASGDEAVTLNGTGSNDSDGTIVSYEWREGGSLIATGATPTVTFAVGTHTVTLTVTDDDGATDTDDVVITVNANQAPTASFTVTASGLTVNVDGSGSTDPDGTIAAYSWNWGDGSPNGSGVTASHTYANAGTYTITLTVTDNGGATASTSKTVSVGQTQVVSENFDDGVADGWTLSGLWRVAGNCSTPPSTPSYLGYHQPTMCNYSTGSRTTGSATVDANLTGKTGATLTFWHRFQKETYAAVPYDIMRVEVSTNGGATWTTLRQWDSRNANQLAWISHSVDLSAYAGGAIKLRFFFDSVDSLQNVYAGWYLDDVEVTAS